MKLSVIIVNYNVRAYLEQCLRTVFKALEGFEGEVFVVDNQSTDGSVEMVRRAFPVQVRLMANTENVGFSRANNQAIRASTGEHVLLLNPDTVVGEDVFRKVVAFLDADPKAGGLGVKMIDGTGSIPPREQTRASDTGRGLLQDHRPYAPISRAAASSAATIWGTCRRTRRRPSRSSPVPACSCASGRWTK
jgi:GT2 family glycosyltransferase